MVPTAARYLACFLFSLVLVADRSASAQLLLERVPSDEADVYEVSAPVVYYFEPLEFVRPPRGRNRGDLLTVRYLFYYREDIGSSGHLNDLESATFTFEVGANPSDPERPIAMLLEIEGAAHGSSFYSNRLRIRDKESGQVRVRDLTVPVTLLVEENKHAVSPDRNADGAFTPGYDVNGNVVDAWGIRDSLGAGWLGSLSYQAHMTKPRFQGDRLFPPTGSSDGPRYTLRRLPRGCRNKDAVKAVDAALGETFKKCPTQDCGTLSIEQLLKSKGVFPISLWDELKTALAQVTVTTIGDDDRYLGVGQVFPLGSLLVGGTFGVEGRLLRAVSGPDQSSRLMIEALGFFTPSLTRAADWYVAAGATGRTFRVRDPDAVVEQMKLAVQISPLIETGLWFRWASRISVRVGVRLDNRKEPKFVTSLSINPAANPSR